MHVQKRVLPKQSMTQYLIIKSSSPIFHPGKLIFHGILLDLPVSLAALHYWMQSTDKVYLYYLILLLKSDIGEFIEGNFLYEFFSSQNLK